jgi:hypothetical protein
LTCGATLPFRYRSAPLPYFYHLAIAAAFVALHQGFRPQFPITW